jgi:molecular chaperone GrpE
MALTSTEERDQNRDAESLASAPASESAGREESLEMWRDRAQRLQAEMENYRKRQQRLAEGRVLEERERLLSRLLQVADELEQALHSAGLDTIRLQHGLELTYRNLMQHLSQEGVEPIKAQGQPFDPLWHEAADVIPHTQSGVPPQTIVEVLRPGYRIGSRLLRPARVLVSA